jgi:tRNA1Val (adenine37-N6)-methyltransferase
MSGEITIDDFLNGRLQVKQKKTGYRFSIDAILLAHHVQPKADDVLLDLGTGCGILPLILSVLHPAINIYGVEIQKELADMAAANVKNNGLEARSHIIHTDMRRLTPTMFNGPVDMVISNPPFRKINAGRINPDDQRALARHEIAITLTELVQTASGLLRTGGKFILIHLAERLTELMVAMCNARLEPKKLRMIHSRRESKAKLVLVEGRKNARPGIITAPPLFVYRNEAYTGEVEDMLFFRQLDATLRETGDSSPTVNQSA